MKRYLFFLLAILFLLLCSGQMDSLDENFSSGGGCSSFMALQQNLWVNWGSAPDPGIF